MATRADIITDTLRNLRVVGAGQTATAEDATIVGKKLDDLYSELRGEGLTNDGSGVWALTAVPNEFINHLTVMASSRCADTYHLPDDRIVRLRLEEIEAKNRIRKLAARSRTDDPAVTEQL